MGLVLGLLQPAEAEALGVTYDGDPAVLDRIGADINRATLAG
jgi:hypothetical protein